MKIKGKKNKKRIAVIAGVAVLGCAVGGVFIFRGNARKKAASTAALSTTVTKGDISTTVVGTGTLAGGDEEYLAIPTGVIVKEILVQAGDTVEKKQKLASLDEVSIANVLVSIKEEMDDVDDELDSLSSSKKKKEGTKEYLKAKVLNAQMDELEEMEDDLNALLKSPYLLADRAGVISEIYVSENSQAGAEQSGSEQSTSSSSGLLRTAYHTGEASAKTEAAQTTVSVSDASVEEMVQKLVANNEKAALEKTDALAGTTTAHIVKLSDAGGGSGGGSGSGSSGGGSTANEEIKTCKLSVTAPVTGEKPQSTIAETDSYKGSISWTPADMAFQEDVAYTAKITLEAKSGYEFSTNIRPDVSGAAGVSGSGSGGKMTIEATFPKTAKTDSQSGNNSDAGNAAGTGNSGSTANTGSTGTTGNAGAASGSAAAGNSQKDAGKSGGSFSFGSSKSGGSGGSSGGSSSSAGSTSSASGTDSGYYNLSEYETAAFAIARSDQAVVSINVDELDIMSIEMGQSAQVTLDALEDETFEGQVTSIASEANSSSSSSAKYAVEITFAKNAQMKLGMSASATIVIKEAKDALVIPVSALQERGGQSFVYTSEKDGTLGGETQVETGLSNGDQVEIISGLNEGDTVYYQKEGSSDSDFSGFGGGFPGGDMPGGGMPSGGMPSGRPSGERPSGNRPSGGSSGGFPGGMPGQ